MKELCKTEEIEEITKGTKLHHTSLYRDYVSRKMAGRVVPYDGRFGRGYQVFRPNYRSTTYCFCDYYIFPT